MAEKRIVTEGLEAAGRLPLFELAPDGPAVLAETQLLESQSWTVPALAGHRLYVRDRQRILAAELRLQPPEGDS